MIVHFNEYTSVPNELTIEYHWSNEAFFILKDT